MVSMFSAKLNGVLGQVRSLSGGGEIEAALSLILDMDVKGMIITGDAIYSNGKLCRLIKDKGGDFVFTLKSNQQEWCHEAKHIFRLNPWPEVERKYKEEVEKDHGRIEYRSIRVMNWPYNHRKDGFETIKQVAEITRYRKDTDRNKTGKSISKTYIITSLTESQANPKQLLNYNRNHWKTENLLHRSRDTILQEDKQIAAKGNIPHANAAINNLALTLIKKAKETNQKLQNSSLEMITKAFSHRIPLAISMLV